MSNANAVFDQVMSQQSEAQASQNNAPETEEVQGQDQSHEGSGQSQPQQVELDKLEKFMFEGKEWSPKDLREAMMRQADYTRKTQELSKDRQFIEEKKFVDNLQYDLSEVRNNPHLAEKFRQTYPEKYHAYLDFVLQKEMQQSSQQQQPQVQLPKEIMDRLSKVDQIEKQLFEKEVEATTAQLDSMYATMQSKYPMADEKTVTAMARSVLDAGTKLTPEVWERIFKEDHSYHEGRYKKVYSSQVNQQKQANRVAKDVPTGGQAAMSSAKKMSFDEVTKDIMSKVRAGVTS